MLIRTPFKLVMLNWMLLYKYGFKLLKNHDRKIIQLKY